MKIRSFSIATAVALCVVAPFAAGRAQATGMACNDGTMSAAVGKGACSGHGGVKAATKASSKAADATAGKTKMAKSGKKTGKSGAKMAKPSTKMEGGEKMAKPKKTSSMPKAADKDAKDATAECKDHTYSHAASHSGACSGHGGVLKFLK